MLLPHTRQDRSERFPFEEFDIPEYRGTFDVPTDHSRVATGVDVERESSVLRRPPPTGRSTVLRRRPLVIIALPWAVAHLATARKASRDIGLGGSQ